MGELPPSLRDRLQWTPATGSVFDGPRRYLLMRPDVLMGALAALDAPLREAVLDALATSAQQHGARSLQAYAEQAPGNAQALLAATVQAAADLGWGRWVISRPGPDSLALEVSDSPFVAGWRAAAQSGAQRADAGSVSGPVSGPVCGPIRGMLGGLAQIVLGATVQIQVQVQVQECQCAACDASSVCRFEARVVAGHDPRFAATAS